MSDEPTVHHTDWYELLCRFARAKGLDVLLHSVVRGTGRGPHVDMKLAVLEVRRRGETVAHAYIGDHDPYEALIDAADSVITQLELIGEPFEREAA